MVTTTTPNPDDEAALRRAYQGGQTYPEPADHPPLIETTEQLLLALVTHPHQNERFHAFEGMRPVGVARVTWLEFECGTRLEVNGR